MKQITKIGGIHHITAISSFAAENLEFYRNVLGLRLVKKTVNFDDPYTYHLYYGDSAGSPGTIMTFFPWEASPRGKSGAGMITATAFSIPEGSIEYWENHLTTHGIEIKESIRFGDRVIQFEDPHGLILELIETPLARSINGPKHSSIPAAHAIIGFHSATALHHSVEETKILLTDAMGMVLHDREQDRYRFKMKNEESFGHFYDVVVDPQAESGRQGAGTVHHIAFRTPTDDSQNGWQKSIREHGFSVTPVRDRKYFKSIYFHAPGGILFEIATDPPGFAIDENQENLGSGLLLPDQYEPMRSEIENRLPKLEEASRLSSPNKTDPIEAVG